MIERAKKFVKENRTPIVVGVVTFAVTAAVTAKLVYDPEDYFTSIGRVDNGDTIRVTTKHGHSYETDLRPK